MSTIAQHPRAKLDYDISKTYEAGLVLSGPEVKSVRNGDVSLKGAYATLKAGELWLLNAHIGPYKKAGGLVNYEPTKSRKLLLHKRELAELIGALHTQHLTLVPISIYTRGRRIKVEIGLARGRKKYEKREILKKRTIQKEIRQTLRQKV
ncbi:MAG: SsrA-binding protein [Candidatus Magasanikbacteria bacterium GW2011_GWA2_50_22]|uniref:SsrA-binding protein n=1 Tax=Candidatus Magasanikbacteria bacterium GW2011_GWA2_50_22 TaxID=1619043 RepID=A0A0G1WFI2_9BACT|nr:MAG: SsrA-binding protein [Candidatus Magasanikbacteria bacterium GW2011_GWA2_50_22]